MGLHFKKLEHFVNWTKKAPWDCVLIKMTARCYFKAKLVLHFV